MSYILNALRKSERERQAVEPDTVTNRIVVHQPPLHQNSTKLIAALIAINLAFLVYFFGFSEKTPPAVTQPVASVTKTTETSRLETTSQPHTTTKPAAPKIPPIAEIVEARSVASVTPPSQPAPVKPVAVKKQPIEPVKPMLESQQPVIQTVEPAEDAIKKPVQVAATAPATLPVPVQAKSDLPFLNELPAEFSRALPDLPINVFSYSSTPAERFVMIDMVKYVPGQRIKDLLELKEIRPDSIVVSYNDRTFKIRRP
jgi:general secretion pathway protein B